MPNFCGIDPGEKSGAWAIVNEKFEIIERSDFTDFVEFYNAMKLHDVKGVCIENVWQREGNSKASGGSFMKNIGGYHALIQVLGLKMLNPVPQKWQKFAGVSITKTPFEPRIYDQLQSVDEFDKEEKKRKDQNARANKKALKDKSIEIAKQFYGISDKISDGHADALHMARMAVHTFHGRS